jgi:uncharacterized membrane protein YoaK (UPF0700 family)
MSIALHSTPTLFSLRHTPSFFMLAFAAGSVNAGALLACQRFVTHVTGTATRLGVDASLWPLAFDYALVLACFVAGAAASVLAIDRRHHRGEAPRYALPLVIVSAILAVVAISGRAGLYGPFGGSVEQPADFLLLSMLGFAMGLQNASVATSTGLAVRTTHMTGPASDLGVHLATSLFTAGEARANALRAAGLRAGKLTAFIAGGAAMVPLARTFGYLAFLVPAAIVVLAAHMSFVPSKVRSLAAAPTTA